MQRHVISVASITYAIKGRDLLRKQGTKVFVERKTNSNGNAGCGYVIVAYGNKDKIVQTLKLSGIKILDINSFA